MSPGFSPTEYEAIGVSYYKKKEYQQALQAFTAGINASAIPTVALYDYRAATHEKLADFHAAVKDGRDAIKLNRQDVRGYLRLASVFQKQNELGKAVGMYKYGMTKVPVGKNDFQVGCVHWMDLKDC
jgi:F-box/TPR repeat protein Pof3